VIVSASALSGLLRVSGSYHTVVLAACVGSTARPADNGEAVVGERIAISDFGTACAGQNLAGSSDDGAEPGNASVGRHGRLIQSESHQASVISHGEILPRGTLLVRQFVSQRPRIMAALGGSLPLVS
jgi:hypothetical protein